MSSYRLPGRRPARAPIDPVGYTTRRLSSWLIVAAAIGGLVVASLLDGAAVRTPFAIAIGLVLFVAAASLATRVAARDTGAASSAAAENWLGGWGHSSQLGPDPELVVGRKTGARV